MNTAAAVLLYFVFAPLIGGLLSGIDRKITARMQSRVGPPVLQPFYDVLKLLDKENLVVRRSQNFYIVFHLLLTVFTGALFFAGGDLLLVIFAFTLADIFLVLGGYKASSPYSFLGAQRELLQMMSYEPAIILNAVGMYLVTKSFFVADIVEYASPLAVPLPGVLASYLFILTTKFRKSPFDLSMSHHAHQELVKGLSTEFSGSALAVIEFSHWYETVLALGFVYLFFAHSAAAGIAASLAAFFFVILMDNTFARVRWQKMLAGSWLAALLFGLGNIFVLFFVMRGR